MKEKNYLKIGIGWKRALLGVICLLMAIAAFQISDSMDGMWQNDLASEIAENVLIDMIFLGGIIGIILLLNGCLRTYKVDHRGVTTYYLKIFDFFVPWEECVYIGLEKSLFLYIVCIRNTGSYALNIPYDKKILAKLQTYVPENMTLELWQDGRTSRRRRIDLSQITLKDTPGEMVIDMNEKQKNRHKVDKMLGLFFVLYGGAMLLVCIALRQSTPPFWMVLMFVLLGTLIVYVDYYYYGRNVIINREGITTVSHRSGKRVFYSWQDFERIGVDCSTGRREGNGFWIFCKTKNFGPYRKIMIEYSKKRYEQFVTYVPEGLVTDPPTQRFELEWLKRISNGNRFD